MTLGFEHDEADESWTVGVVGLSRDDRIESWDEREKK